MADTTLRTRYPTGKTLYTQISSNILLWNGSAFVAKVLANWGTYATATPETPVGFGEYVCQFPTPSPAGNYSWTTYLQAGGSPASTDVPLPGGNGFWDGTTFGGAASVVGNVGGSVASVAGNVAGSVASVAGNVAGSVASVLGSVTATLPSPAPLTYGPIGTGSRAVNQDYPTAGNLAFRTSGGQGIGGASIRAYLSSEYAGSPNTATIRGQTTTLSSGSWANNVDLDPGAYSLTFDAPGYQTKVVSVTVS